MRFRLPEFVLGALFVVSLVMLGFVFAQQAAPPEPQQSRTEYNGSQAKGQGGEAFWQRLITDPVAFFTLWIAAFTAVLGVATIGLLKAGERQIEAATKAAVAADKSARFLRNAERPYLIPFEPKIFHFVEAIDNRDPYAVLEIYLDVTNIGKGVGFIKGYGIAHEVCADGSQGGVELTVRDEIAVAPLTPDATWDPGLPFDVFQLDLEEDRRLLSRDQKTLYVYGFIRYSDMFDVVRRTGFMFAAIRSGPNEAVLAMTPHSMWYDEEEPSD